MAGGSLTLQQGTPAGSRHNGTILHVVESLASGVATALEGYMLNTPEYRHVVLGGTRRGYELRAVLRGAAELHALPSSKASQAAVTLRAIRTHRPDVVHCHSSWAGTYGRVAATLAGVPVLYSPHGYAFLRDDVAGWKRLVFKGVEAVLGRLTTGYVTAGPNESALTRGFQRRAPIAEALPALRGDDEIVAARSRCPAGGRSHDVVTLGRVSPQKDPHWFIATISEMRQQGWTGTATWVGGGDPGGVEELRAAGVEVTGWMRRDDALHRLVSSGVYLHTAAWEAGIPYSILEAGLLGLPVVARRLPELTDRPGLRLALSPADAAREIVRLTADPDWHRTVAEQCVAMAGPGWMGLQRDNLLTAYGQVEV